LRLISALHDLCRNGSWNSRSIGKWLARNKDRPVAGLVLRQVAQGGGKGQRGKC
jgi:hypothetical protein